MAVFWEHTKHAERSDVGQMWGYGPEQPELALPILWTVHDVRHCCVKHDLADVSGRSPFAASTVVEDTCC